MTPINKMAAPLSFVPSDDSASIVWNNDVLEECPPSEWRSLVSKRVEVLSKDNKRHTGWVFTIDPVSKSIVLAQFPDEQGTTVEVIMGHAIDTVTHLASSPTSECADRLEGLFPAAGRDADFSPAELSRRKADLRRWLEKHHIPVAVSGERAERLSIAGALHIEPPYRAEDCMSANEIILARVQALMRAQPMAPSSPGTCGAEGT